MRSVLVENERSGMVGFRLEGTIRHGRMVSEYCDYQIWGLIREDIAEK